MSNPYSKILLSKKMKQSVASVKRIDKNGSLYYMECTGNYYGAISLPIKILGLLGKPGCSAFTAFTPGDEVITGRNYDMPHLDESGKVFGVDLVLKCKPEGKYQSIAGADAAWLSKLGVNVVPGAFDDKKTKITALALMPYLCMDGMNEKGLSVSILALDLKKGEQPVCQKQAGKKKVIITMLVRYMLDSCKDLDEAIKLAQSYNLVNTLGADYHLYVSDANGRSAVFEWRHNQFRAVETDACTNFYVGDDDAEDCYYPDGLKEKYVPMATETIKKYHFGYGHGYERFKTVIQTLNIHTAPTFSGYKTTLKSSEAVDLLASVAQEYNGMLTSFTQYSVVYNQSKLSAEYYLMQDYKKGYKFTF